MTEFNSATTGFRPVRAARSVLRTRAIPVIVAALFLSGCESLLDTYEPTVAPSTNPQIVDEVQKDDPRAEMGAREHPRIVASYGGEYRDVKT
jgi:predicted Zn-dependent protease